MLPATGVTYRAFVDPSGGSEDAMTLAIAHGSTRPDERVSRSLPPARQVGLVCPVISKC